MTLAEIESLTLRVVERYIMSGHLTPRSNPYLNHKRSNPSATNQSTNSLLRVMTNPEVKSVACPTCGAGVTGACLVKLGFKETFTLTEVHQARIDAYIAAGFKA